MALICNRVVNYRLATAGSIFRSIYCTQVHSVTMKVTGAKKDADETFFQRNERLNRPLSPHLTIYKPQLTSLLSVTHRATGMAMTGVLYGFGIGVLALPSTFPHFIDSLTHVNSGLVFLLKLGVAVPFAYHYCNGIRHLLWDFGKGLRLKQVYQSGYVVLGATLGLAFLLVLM